MVHFLMSLLCGRTMLNAQGLACQKDVLTPPEQRQTSKGTINLAIQESNTAFELSRVHTDLRLVHMYRDTERYDEAAGYSDALNKITGKTDGYMDSVHAERENHKADVVVLIIQNPQYCGVAWLGPSKDRMFSVTGWNCATGYYSFAHEIMHNLGCNHDRGTTRACSSTSYNYGYRDPDGQFRSIMGYNCRTGQCDQIKKNGCTRVQRVSNPDITYQGKAIGTATANNAKRINDVRKIVAQYYDSAAGQASLSNKNGGCNAIQTEASCTSSRDGRAGKSFSNSPCQWCCGKACTTNNANKCEPKQWLFLQPNYVGRSKNGVGEDNCNQASLSNKNNGCNAIQTEASCTSSRDGRAGQSFSNSPCQWCCGRACTTNNANKCEPKQWLLLQPNYVGWSKNGIGEDNCNQAPPCIDKYGQCPQWAKYYCTGRWASWMATNCQKSCSACS